MKEESHQGSCFCGAVQFSVTGAPVAMGYCHCTSCRHWSASPLNAFTLWKPETVNITKGSDNLGTYSKTLRSNRKWCKTCGGHVLTEHPHWQLVDVYASVLSDFPFQAGVHVNYSETVLHLHDGVMKQHDLPQEMGGSGTAIGD